MLMLPVNTKVHGPRSKNPVKVDNGLKMQAQSFKVHTQLYILNLDLIVLITLNFTFQVQTGYRIEYKFYFI